MSQNTVSLPESPKTGENVPETPITEAQRKKLIGELLVMIHKEQPFMTAKYQALLRQNGSLLTNSMVFAYTKAFNDVIKLLIKESNDEKEK